MLVFDHVCVFYGDTPVLRELSFHVEGGLQRGLQSVDHVGFLPGEIQLGAAEVAVGSDLADCQRILIMAVDET